MSNARAASGLAVGLGLVTGSTLILQTAFTRLFSVIFLYHFALVAVSAAMFGMAVGAVLVHILPGWFPEEDSQGRAGDCAALMSLATVGGLLGCLYVPFDLNFSAASMGQFLGWMLFVVAPFLCSGLTVCLCLTRFPWQVGRLYAYDLAGAALGCLVAVALLNQIGPFNTVLVSACLAGLGAVVMAVNSGRRMAAALSVALPLALLASNFASPWLRIHYVLGRAYAPADTHYEFWNAFSFLFVSQSRQNMVLWGAGSKAADYVRSHPFHPEHQLLLMDTRAATRMIHFQGDWDAVSWLNWDIISLPHDLRSEGPVCVIGPGGGRDILAALLPSKGKREVTGVEINPLTYHVVRELETEYNGLSQFPNVHYVNDEARSWMSRDQHKYEVITVPLVDTWASTSAGAFALSENSLYTVEAFRLYLRHLQPGGLLSVSRWWHHGSVGETDRLLMLAAEALRQEGVADPRGHIFMCLGDDVTNLLASPTPFTAEDEKRLREACDMRGYQPMLTPTYCMDPRFEKFLADPSLATGWFGPLHMDLSPTTDDRPYFFHSFSLRNLWSGNLQSASGNTSSERDAMVILSSLVLAVTAVAAAFWLRPVLAARSLRQTRILSYFGMLGFGFMFFESTQMQRLNLFLGYPIYSITVVLFSLLLSTAAGSAWSERRIKKGDFPVGKVALTLILGLVVVNFATVASQQALAGGSTPVRILVAGLLSACMGVPLGTLFPYGLRVAQQEGAPLAWCWALNGATSAAAAVYAIAISLSYGIQATYAWAIVCYAVAYALIRPFSLSRE